MDPALRQLLRQGAGGDRLEAIARLKRGHARLPPGAAEIARFGQVRTLRLLRADIPRIWAHPAVASLKAPRLLQLERPAGGSRAPHRPASPRPPGLVQTGRGVVLGVIDWGFDVAHPAFLTARGSSRVRALWDQRDAPAAAPGRRPAPYGYGRVLDRAQINAALRTNAPYARLAYHPGDADAGIGSHGTNVADIAAGSARPGGAGGMAPSADLVFVHLASSPLGGLADLGDSVRILEAVDFIARCAGGQPLAINISIGRHGGPHTGLTLVERALDAFVAGRPNTQIAQSAGNYRAARAHAGGHLAPGRSRRLAWRIAPGDRTGNELEIWYSNRDRFSVRLIPPRGAPVAAELGSEQTLRDASGAEIGRIYHRAFDPNTPDHHVDIFLDPAAPPGEWRIDLTGAEVSDGRYDAWIERDRGGLRGQSRFRPQDVRESRTTGSICNGFLTIAVGAADLRLPFPRAAFFASEGPTRDGRTKPDVAAAGVQISGARSAPRGQARPADRLTRMTGASQAAPQVAGLIALCLEAGGGALGAHDLRRAIIGTAQPASADPAVRAQLGAGIVQPAAAISAAQSIAAARQRRPRTAGSRQDQPGTGKQRSTSHAQL